MVENYKAKNHSWERTPEENQRGLRDPKEEHLRAKEEHLREEGRQVEAAPLVSVVIPCYNQARFLGEAIRSVLVQSYPRFEIVVVDDGSSDATLEVASRYAQVRCIHQENRGLAGARNTGIRQSRGSYLVFLDADDRLLPEALDVGAKYLKARPECAFVSGHYRLIAADGSPLPPIREQPCPDKEQYMEMLRANYIIMPAVIMHRRSVFEALGGFDSSVNAAADYDLCLRVARRFPVYCHGEVVAEYRMHGSNMNRDYALNLKESIVVLRSQRRYIKGNRRYKEAYRTGTRIVQEEYGMPLASKVLAHLRKHELKQATRGMVVLLWYYPRILVRAWQKLRLPGRSHS